MLLQYELKATRKQESNPQVRVVSSKGWDNCYRGPRVISLKKLPGPSSFQSKEKQILICLFFLLHWDNVGDPFRVFFFADSVVSRIEFQLRGLANNSFFQLNPLPPRRLLNRGRPGVDTQVMDGYFGV